MKNIKVRYLNLLTAASLISGMILMVGHVQKSLADNSSPWTGPIIPQLQKEGELTPNTFQPFSYDGNRDCTDHTFITQPSGIFPYPPFIQSEQSITACAISTPAGIIEPNGYFNPANAGVSGKLLNFQSNNSFIIPIPHSLNILHFSSAPIDGLYLFLTKNFASALNTTISSTKIPTFSFNRTDDLALRDKANNLLAAQTDSLSFSNNGKWMVVNASNRALIRVNLETFEILPFGPAFNYNQGLNPHPQTSISDDGRYAVVSSTAFNTFKVYDLQSCTNVPTGALTSPANCQSKELWSFIQQKVSNLKSINTVRFLNDYMVSLYVNAPYSASNNISKYILSAAGYGGQKIDYLALGDSFASGEGVFKYQEGTDTDINKCHIASLSYPYLLADDMNLDSSHSVACSGAHLNDIINVGKDYRGQVKDSRPRSARSDTEIESIINNFSPGFIDQLDFVKIYRPKVVSLSMIGNDIGFGNIMKRCAEPDTCYSSYEDRLEIVRQINSKFSDLVGLYQQLKSANSPDSKLYVIGYPDLTYSGGKCAANVHLNSTEVNFASLLVKYLNTFIAQAASKAGVAYINVESAFVGHRLCETKSSQVAINGLTAGTDGPTKHGPFAIESYHPNKLGHQLLEESILGKTQAFHLTMPAANGFASPPPENGLDILNVAKTGRQVNNLNYDNNLSNDVIYRKGIWRVTVNAVDDGQTALKSLSPYQILLDGVVLGAATTSPSGQLDTGINLQLPADLPAGLHTIDVIGDDASGQPTDITQTVVVGDQADDINGDGQPDTSNQCLIVPISGQDADLDGIDDSCDGFIDDNPLLTSLYRARQGNPSKGEKADFTYLERNVILAREKLGLKDYDPDNDGWSTIAKGSNLYQRGDLAKFWVEELPSQPPDQLNHYLPHLSVRTERSGCIQLTPGSLAEVRKYQIRRFNVESKTALTCRGEDSDQDHDGLEDNTEPLYRVKYGNPLLGQDSQKIYMERNAAAAEAQLGISDYSQNKNGWAAVGVTNQPKQQLAGMALIDPQSNDVLVSYPADQSQQETAAALSLLSDNQRRNIIPAAILRSINGKCRAMMPYRLSVVQKGQGRRMINVPSLAHISCPTDY